MTPKFLWRYIEGIGYVLIYDGHIEDVELGSPIAMIMEKTDHVHVLSPLTFLNKGCANAKEAMFHVQQGLIDFCAAVAMTSDPNFPNHHWPVAT